MTRSRTPEESTAAYVVLRDGQTVADYAATMATDPQASDLFEEVHNNDPADYTYPEGSNRDESRMCDEVRKYNHSKQVMKAVLDEAADKVCGDRHEDYGPPEINHKRTAEFWSTYLGIKVTAVQVCEMNILQKLSRQVNKYKHDGPVDIIGFAANGAACHAAQLPVNGT